MILDSSAIIAVLQKEQGYEDLLSRMDSADTLAVGAPTLVEVGLVLRGRFGLEPIPIIEKLLDSFDMSVLAFEDDHWRIAIDAFSDFGKSIHPAALNFGDCLSFASARVARRGLIFVGNDFRLTDIET